MNITLYIAFGIICGFTQLQLVLEHIIRKYRGTTVYSSSREYAEVGTAAFTYAENPLVTLNK
jgi:hypothetical protein